MSSIKVKSALWVVLVLTASAAQANDNLGHRYGKAPDLKSYALVHQPAPTSPGWSGSDLAGQPTTYSCPQLEGYPDCH